MTHVSSSNLRAMSQAGFKAVLIALQDGNVDKAVDVCINALKCFARIEGTSEEEEAKCQGS